MQSLKRSWNHDDSQRRRDGRVSSRSRWTQVPHLGTAAGVVAVSSAAQQLDAGRRPTAADRRRRLLRPSYSLRALRERRSFAAKRCVLLSFELLVLHKWSCLHSFLHGCSKTSRKRKSADAAQRSRNVFERTLTFERFKNATVRSSTSWRRRPASVVSCAAVSPRSGAAAATARRPPPPYLPSPRRLTNTAPIVDRCRPGALCAVRCESRVHNFKNMD